MSVDTMSVERTARALTEGLESPRERARALYFFVQRDIRFGFAAAFDEATPTSTLRTRRGHCNPQGALFVALCRSVGLEARQHFVSIGNDVLHGVFPGVGPATLTHSYVELRLEGRSISLDGYIVDPPLFEAASARLRREGRTLGYGIHGDGTLDWDGEADAFAQMVSPSMILRDLGAYDDPSHFYRSARYTQGFSFFGAMAYRALGVGALNRNIDRIRAEA